MISHCSNKALNLNVAELKLSLGLNILVGLCDKPNISDYPKITGTVHQTQRTHPTSLPEIGSSKFEPI